MFGSDQPIAFDDAAIREVLGAARDPRRHRARRSTRRSSTVDGWAALDPRRSSGSRRPGRRVRRARPAHHRRPSAARVLPPPPLARDAVAAPVAEPGPRSRDRRAPCPGRSARTVAPASSRRTRCYPRLRDPPHPRRRARLSAGGRGATADPPASTGPSRRRRSGPPARRSAGPSVAEVAPATWDALAARSAVRDPVQPLGVPPGLVGRLRRDRPRGDAPRRGPGRAGRRRPGRDRAAHAPPRGGAGRRRRAARRSATATRRR